MAVESYLSTQKVQLNQNGLDFGGNPLAFNCAYELGSLLLHNGSELIKSWSLIQLVMHLLISHTNTKSTYFL